MGQLRIEMNSTGIQAVLKSQEVQDLLAERAERVAAAAGAGMEASVRVGRTRARGSVITATRQARESEAASRALTRAIDAGR